MSLESTAEVLKAMIENELAERSAGYILILTDYKEDGAIESNCLHSDEADPEAVITFLAEAISSFADQIADDRLHWMIDRDEEADAALDAAAIDEAAALDGELENETEN